MISSTSLKPMTGKSASRRFDRGSMANSRNLIQQAIADLPNSDAPDLDARWLLAHLLQIDHRDPQLHRDFPIPEELAESFKTSYGRPRDDVVMTVSQILRRLGGAKNTRSPVLCCMLSAVHACMTHPSHPLDASMYPARE